MTVTFEDLNNTRKKLVVEVSGDEISAEAESVAKLFAEQASIPGFRPGKAPAAMIRKRFGAQIDERTKQGVAQKAYKHAVEDQALEVYGLVEVEDVELKPGEDAELVFTVDLQPQVTIPVYEGITIEAPPETVTEEEVEHARHQVLEQRAEFNETDEPAQAGDFVQHSYTGSIEGQPISEIVPEEPILASQERTWEEAGSSRTGGIAGIAAGLLGLQKGDTRTVEHTFPDDHAHEVLQGKTATYEIEVFEVRRKTIPALDEDFLKSMNLESEDAFNEAIREDLQRRKTQQVRGQKRNKLVEALLQQAPFDVPETAMAQERDSILREHIQQQYQQGASEEDLESHKEQLFEEASKIAEGRVRAQFLLLAIARKEELQLKTEDMQQILMQEAMAQRIEPEKLAARLKKDENELRELQRQALISKTLDYLLERANVHEAAPDESHEGHDHNH